MGIKSLVKYDVTFFFVADIMEYEEKPVDFPSVRLWIKIHWLNIHVLLRFCKKKREYLHLSMTIVNNVSKLVSDTA